MIGNVVAGAPVQPKSVDAAQPEDGDAKNAPLWQPALAMGGIASAAMVGPSMFPKDKLLQRVGIGAALGIGALGGLAVEGTVRGLDSLLPGDRLDTQLGVAGVGLAAAGGASMLTGGALTGKAAFIRSIGTIMGVGAGVGAAGTAVARHDGDIPGHDAWTQMGTAALAGGTMLGASVLARRAAVGDVADVAIRKSLLVEPGSLGQLAKDHGYLVRGTHTSGADPAYFDKLPPSGQRFLTEMPRAEEIAGVMRGPDDEIVAKENGEVAIKLASGEELAVKEPMRAYVGLDNYPPTGDELADARTRAIMAADELEKLGAFGTYETLADGTRKVIEQPRKEILLVAPTATGFVNPISAGAFEMYHLGDTAIATVQVGKGKAAAEIQHVARATESHYALRAEVGRRVAALPDDVEKPNVRLYGESFGAWASQNSLAGDRGVYRKWLATKLGKWNGDFKYGPKEGVESLDATGTKQSINVGTPAFSLFRPRMVASKSDAVLQVRSTMDEALINLTPEQADAKRIVFLQHDRDPVGIFKYRALYENYLGKKGQRDPSMPQHQRNIPVISGVQLGLDQQNAQKFAAGTIEEKGHDYRGAGPDFLAKAMGILNLRGNAPISDEAIARVGEWARQVEVLREQQLKGANLAKDPT